jgi:hypothetical protein
MSGNSPVLAVVDATDGAPVVWWVDLGLRMSPISRMCGAWVLDGADSAQTLQALTAGRRLVTTAAGADVLPGPPAPESVDPAATLAAVAATVDELQAAFASAVAARKNGRSLTAPRWPALPDPLDLETAEDAGGEPRTRRALGIARWFERLCTAWDGVEDQRLARTYLRDLGGPATRPLPVVLQAAPAEAAA